MDPNEPTSSPEPTNGPETPSQAPQTPSAAPTANTDLSTPEPWYKRPGPVLGLTAGVLGLALVVGIGLTVSSSEDQVEALPTQTAAPAEPEPLSEREQAIQEAEKAAERYYQFFDNAIANPQTGWEGKSATLIGADKVAGPEEARTLGNYIDQVYRDKDRSSFGWETEIVGVKKVDIDQTGGSTVVLLTCRDRSNAYSVYDGKRDSSKPADPVRFKVKLTVEQETGGQWLVTKYDDNWPEEQPCEG